MYIANLHHPLRRLVQVHIIERQWPQRPPTHIWKASGIIWMILASPRSSFFGGCGMLIKAALDNIWRCVTAVKHHIMYTVVRGGSPNGCAGTAARYLAAARCFALGGAGPTRKQTATPMVPRKAHSRRSGAKFSFVLLFLFFPFLLSR
jgi:hypothetical protein